MEAVQDGIDTLASLEERITRAVQAIVSLRNENEQLQQRLHKTDQEFATISADRDEAQGLLAEYQKENAELAAKVKRLSEDLENLRGERKIVKTRIEKLLGQLDLLSAS